MKYTEKDYPLAPGLLDEKQNPWPSFFISLDYRIHLSDYRARDGVYSRDVTQNGIHIEDRPLPLKAGKVRVRLYRPTGAIGLLPVMLYYHGGAWFLGSVEQVEDFCKAVCEQAGCMVISVDYPRAPACHFPGLFELCYQAAEWVCMHCEELGGNFRQVTIAGDSAGGNLAAAVSLAVRDRGEFIIANQFFIYAVLNLINFSAPSFRLPGGRFKGMARLLKASSNLYLPNPFHRLNPYASPQLAKDLSNLPRTLIAIAQCDGLRDNQLAFAEALDRAGNDVSAIMFKNTVHGFISHTGDMPQGLDLACEAAKFIRAE